MSNDQNGRVLFIFIVFVSIWFGWSQTQIANSMEREAKARERFALAQERVATAFESALDITNALMTDMRAELVQRTADRWRKGDMNAWVDEFRAMNPTLGVPDVR